MVVQPTKIWDSADNVFKLPFVYQYTDTTIGPITFTPEGVLTSLASVALQFTTAGYTLTNNGTIGSTAANSIGLETVSQPTDTGLTKITIGTSGLVFGDNSGIGIFGLTTVNNAGTITGNAYGIFDPYSGNVTITNSGTIAAAADSIYLTGAGTHTITNSGVLKGHVSATGSGIELLTNSGIIDGHVDLGDGNNVLKNTGYIDGNVVFGSGNDKFTDSGSIYTGAGVDMGAGDDVFTGGNSTEYVLDGAGKDKYSLGGGFDVFLAALSPGSGGVFIDTIDGGSSTGFNPFAATHIQGDLYNAASAANGVVINLDTVKHTEPSSGGPTIYAASQASGTDVGIDNIKNFESAFGGAGADIIFGNAGANDLEGNNGHDILHGYAGNDYLLGGMGSDFLFGDKGADTLAGGVTTADNAADYFMYTALSDSTVAQAGRDTITFFEDGMDIIVLQAIPGHTNGTFVGVDTAFVPIFVNFQARALTTLAGWTIQIDANGDAKADMAIDVADAGHTINWSGADFLF